MNLVCLCKSASWLMNVTNSKIIWCSHKSRKYIHPKICRNIIVVLVSFSLHTKFRYKVHVNYSQKYSCFCNMLCFYRLAIFVTRKIFHVVLTKSYSPFLRSHRPAHCCPLWSIGCCSMLAGMLRWTDIVRSGWLGSDSPCCLLWSWVYHQADGEKEQPRDRAPDQERVRKHSKYRARN